MHAYKVLFFRKSINSYFGLVISVKPLGIMERISVLLIVVVFGMKSVLGQDQVVVGSAKVNGVSLVSINKAIDSTNVLPIKSLGANWAATIPFAFMPSHTSPELSFDLDWQWIGERIDGARNYVRELHAQGLSVMIKPQIWIGHGTYTGEIRMASEDDWVKLEENYKKYLLAFANLATEEKVEMICIGTELKHFVTDRPDYWRMLISELRTIYAGKLTYAANWDEYEDISFWGDLDFIGVDAYFPVSKKEKVSVSKLIKGWEPHKAKMDSVSVKFGRPILFTEYGYRSIGGCAVKPWDYSDAGEQNEKCQAVALHALYHVFWEDEKYCGGFLWKWYPDHKSAGGPSNKMFTVQNKKAQKTVTEMYSR